MNEPMKPGDKFRHYKGAEYEFILEATCVATRDTQVVYRSLLNGNIYVRDKVEFLSQVLVKGETKMRPRFERI